MAVSLFGLLLLPLFLFRSGLLSNVRGYSVWFFLSCFLAVVRISSICSRGFMIPLRGLLVTFWFVFLEFSSNALWNEGSETKASDTRMDLHACMGWNWIGYVRMGQG